MKITRLEIEGGGWIWMLPLADGTLSLGTVVSTEYFKSERLAAHNCEPNDWLEQVYLNILSSSDKIRSVLRDGSMKEKVVVNADYSYYNTSKYGTRYACVGGASAFVDPIFASGVYIAMKSASIISEALDKMATEKFHPSTMDVLDVAYQVVRSLVRNFYDPDAVKLDAMGSHNIPNFQQQEKAFQVFNLLLSGKFFDASKKLKDTIELLRNEKKLEQYQYFIKQKKHLLPELGVYLLSL